MTIWHVSDIAVERWMDGTDTLPQAASVEQHLLTCEVCRDRVSQAVREPVAHTIPSLDTVWMHVRDAVELPRPSRFERILCRLGLPEPDAKLVAAAQAFRGPWMTGVLLVLAFVTLAAEFGQASGRAIFLTVAPLLPCLAVAFSYDPSVEPALEQELVTPYSPLRLVLLRSVAVLAVGLPVVVLLSPFLPGDSSYLWLLPAAGFVAGVLALSTWTNPLRAGAAISGAWGLVVLSTALTGSVSAVLHARYQAAYLLLASVSIITFLARSRHLRELRTRGGWL